MSLEPVIVPEDATADWDPPGYEPGPDNPGPVESVHDHGDGEDLEPDSGDAP